MNKKLRELFERYNNKYYFLCARFDIDPLPSEIDFSQHWKLVEKYAELQNKCRCCKVKRKINMKYYIKRDGWYPYLGDIGKPNTNVGHRWVKNVHEAVKFSEHDAAAKVVLVVEKYNSKVTVESLETDETNVVDLVTDYDRAMSIL